MCVRVAVQQRDVVDTKATALKKEDDFVLFFIGPIEAWTQLEYTYAYNETYNNLQRV
jgi:hypothetical protein